MTRQERSWILYDVANSAYSVTITAAVFPIFFKSVAARGMEGFDSTALWGYANGIAEIVIAWVLTAFYVAWANKSYDPEVERLKGTLKH